jgi:hypothetical protein
MKESLQRPFLAARSAEKPASGLPAERTSSHD